MKHAITMSAKHLLCDFYNRYGKRFNPYKEYNRSIEKAVLEKTGETSILITGIGGAYGHTFEGLFARKAMMQGRKVVFFHCGNYLQRCDSVHGISKMKAIRCAVCQAQQDEFVKAFEGESYSYDSLLSNDDKQLIESASSNILESLTEEHLFLGVQIDGILYTALQRYHMVADPVVKKDEVTYCFVKTILSTLIAMDKLVAKFGPKYVLSSHGVYSTWGSVVEYCKAHGISVITYGQNYNKNGIEFSYDDSYLTAVLNDTDNGWTDKELSITERDIVQKFLDERINPSGVNGVAFDYYKKSEKAFLSKDQICDALGIDHDKKIVGLFPNIPWDGQVNGESAVFPRFRDWLKTTIDYFEKRSDAVLVIRSHPAEVLVGDAAGRETLASMLSDMYPKLPTNVLLLEPKHRITSYALGASSDFGITYSSTVTLELTYLKVPVILCGCPPFRNKGVAFDILSREHYESLLDRGLSEGLKVDEVRLARLFKYLHYFFFMRTMPQTLMEVEDGMPKRFLFGSEEELDKDPVFDEMFHCIEAKTEMDFSRFYQRD